MEIQHNEKVMPFILNTETKDIPIEILSNIRLTSSEIGGLWQLYVTDSGATCLLKYFLKTAKAEDVRSVIKYALNLSLHHLQIINAIFNAEGIPIPVGFTNEDLNIKAPRLFSDSFIIAYVGLTARAGLASFSYIYPAVARSDVKDFFGECIATSVELEKKSTNVLLSKGLYIKPPYLSPESVEFIRSKKYLGSIFGSKRTLNALEITNIYLHIRGNTLKKYLLTGYSQVADSKQVREYFLKGKEIMGKHVDVLTSLFNKDDLPAMTWNAEITDSTTSPFTDKFMLFHISLSNITIAENYGTAVSTSMRKDLVAAFSRLMAEILQYAEDGVSIMIKNGWMEVPPQAVNHDFIARKSH